MGKRGLKPKHMDILLGEVHGLAVGVWSSMTAKRIWLKQQTYFLKREITLTLAAIPNVEEDDK